MTMFEDNHRLMELERNIIFARRAFVNADPLDVPAYDAAETKLRSLQAKKKELLNNG